MKLITILFFLFFSISVKAQKKNPKPIKAKIDFIHKDGEIVEVTVKHKRLHNNRGYSYFVARFPTSQFPDSLNKIGKMITLYPKLNSDSCNYVFQPIKK